MFRHSFYLAKWVFCFISVIAVGQTEISSLSQNKHIVGRYEKFELTFTVSETYDNPFDPEIVDISVTFIDPNANTTVAFAFFYMDYDIIGGVYTNGRNPCWKVRFSPSQLGQYAVTQITIKDNNGTNVTNPQVSFNSVQSPRKGIVRVDDRDPYCLRHDDGSAYLPIGHAVAWEFLHGHYDEILGGSRSISYWHQHLSAMSAAGENWTRIEMVYFYEGQLLEWISRGGHGYWEGVGRLSMQIGHKIDQMIELAEQNDIRIQLVFQNDPDFDKRDLGWDLNPYNIANAISDGGFLENPEDFFTDAKAIRLTKYKYRYIIARWGYSDSILEWELFNEVRYTSDVLDWHEEMTNYVWSVDPFNHLITTSLSEASGSTTGTESDSEGIWTLTNIDVVQSHYYGLEKLVLFERINALLSRYEKPVMMGEFGVGGDLIEKLDRGIGDISEFILELHNGIWSAFHLKFSAHSWWWRIIHEYDLYRELTPLSVYAEGEDLGGYNLSKAEIEVPEVSLYAVAIPGKNRWSSVSTQTSFTIQGNGVVEGSENLSQWIHPSWNKDFHVDPTFTIGENADTLRIHVGAVSESGQPSLRVLVNGQQIFAESYQPGSRNFVTEVPLLKSSGRRGSQVVKIENTGNVWLSIHSYEFVEITG